MKSFLVCWLLQLLSCVCKIFGPSHQNHTLMSYYFNVCWPKLNCESKCSVTRHAARELWWCCEGTFKVIENCIGLLCSAINKIIPCVQKTVSYHWQVTSMWLPQATGKCAFSMCLITTWTTFHSCMNHAVFHKRRTHNHKIGTSLVHK